MKLNIDLQSYSEYTSHNKDTTITDEEVKAISFYYDKGRLNILINGLEIYENKNCGDDFSIDIEVT